MNKLEATELFDRVQNNWNLRTMTKVARAQAVETWHHFLKDVPFEQAGHVIDARALAGGYPPKPAEIFTAVYTDAGDAPPTVSQALADAHSLTDAIQYGLPVPNVHPLVKETIRQIGVQHDLVFKERYEEKRIEYLAGLFENPPTYPDGADKREGTEDNA